ncbi:MAG TPA: NAD-dependent epimerase/dehydratase family protein [Rhabdochlamydiaceae bacterium]|nr:NAD-dependent epimerase/dehydratase family protein [Rhabdochlamydiaceae bacterium]
MSISSKRIFITGIAGFIGFHLAKFLKQKNQFVIGCDNFNDYYDPNLKKKRAAQLANLGIQVIDADICNAEKIAAELENHQISHVVHLAAQAGVRYSIIAPEKYVHSNLQGFAALLEILRRKPKVKLVFASSSSVYGLNQKIPFSETDQTVHPANFYAATKIAGEAIAHSYHHLYGMSIIGLRYFTVYGPWGRPDMAYFLFTDAIMKGKPIVVYDQGKMKRDFTYIDDIVEGTAAALDLDAGFEIFNLGNNSPVEVTNLISIIEKETKKSAIKELRPMQAGEVQTTYADISKSQKALHFQPRTSLEEGMKHFVDWYLEECYTT